MAGLRMVGVVFSYLAVVHAQGGQISFRQPAQRCASPVNRGICCGDAMGNVEATPTDSPPQNVLVGIGVQKAATSFMAYLLSRHPGFLPPVKKELGYFSNDSRTVYSLEDYLTNWQMDGQPSRRQNRMLYEFTPDYLPNAFAACRMKAVLPTAKLLLILRSPVDRFYSHVNMERHFCKEVALAKKFGVQYKEACEGATSALRPVSDLVEAHLEHVRSIGCTFVDGNASRTWMDCQLQSSRFQRDRLARGYYAPQLAWWMEFYPPEDIMILDSNEVTEDAAATLEKVAAFALGKEAAAAFGRPVINTCARNTFGYDPESNLREALDSLSNQYSNPNEELLNLLAMLYPTESGSLPLEMGPSLSRHIDCIVWKIWRKRVFAMSICLSIFLILFFRVRIRCHRFRRSGTKQL